MVGKFRLDNLLTLCLKSLACEDFVTNTWLWQRALQPQCSLTYSVFTVCVCRCKININPGRNLCHKNARVSPHMNFYCVKCLHLGVWLFKCKWELKLRENWSKSFSDTDFSCRIRNRISCCRLSPTFRLSFSVFPSAAGEIRSRCSCDSGAGWNRCIVHLESFFSIFSEFVCFVAASHEVDQIYFSHNLHSVKVKTEFFC